ncbi:geranylgeranyl reductase family protein [Pseudodesulfovibrio cashew]|uniref:Geranylgeranyl reductase family protein n=1 Tax=Pseudodesulfovibrio cashew TaxID=2678688 RepID=A0A6I6J917_9BACT|nr:geranylgeranyl reductase family protein [Pseudodesulfovibrio cashew]QGY39326.1 geranylgeranyl reductase family protein [Pseudodesulfovibrio cashew]
MGNRYDVIICGAGPAGATAGTVLARQGLSVALFDRARFPRKKLCGGLLTWKSVKLLEAVFGETPESMIRSGVINHVSEYYSIRTFEHGLASGRLPYPFHFTDRTRFDDMLLGHARATGAEVFEDEGVTACDPEKGSVTLASGRTVSARHVLGADGANSVVRSAFPRFDRDRFRRNMAPALEISLPPEDFPRPVDHPELIVGILDAGYGWVFPNRDRVILGICGLRRKKENFSELFRAYLTRLGVDMDLVPALHGHPLPYGNYLGAPFHQRALLAGDAGGYVEPLFGEGIFFALCTGLYAGEALAESQANRVDPGPRYARRLHRQIIPELKASDRLRWALFQGMRIAGPGSLSLFVNAGATRLAEMVHGIRSYAWLRRKEWDFL